MNDQKRKQTVNLIQFLFPFIDIQIQKCVIEFQSGVGEDSPKSARLAALAVEQLTRVIQPLLVALENDAFDRNAIEDAVHTSYFLLYQERQRSQAAMYVDVNHVHVDQQKRLNQQLAEFKKMAKALGIDLCVEPSEAWQIQYAYNSYCIVNAAVSLPLQLLEQDEDAREQSLTQLKSRPLVVKALRNNLAGYYLQQGTQAGLHKLQAEAITFFTEHADYTETCEAFALGDFENAQQQRLQTLAQRYNKQCRAGEKRFEDLKFHQIRWGNKCPVAAYTRVFKPEIAVLTLAVAMTVAAMLCAQYCASTYTAGAGK